MRVREIMSEPVKTVPAGMRLEEARELMRRLRMHHLIVKDAGKVVGVLSASDVADAHLFGSVEELHVNDVMSGNVTAIDQGETVRRAASVMQGRSIGCLAVTRYGKLVGIVTVADLLRLLGKGGDRPAAKARATLNHRNLPRSRSITTAPLPWTAS
jgi:CBS domain-containing protein